MKPKDAQHAIRLAKEIAARLTETDRPEWWSEAQYLSHQLTEIVGEVNSPLYVYERAVTTHGPPPWERPFALERNGHPLHAIAILILNDGLISRHRGSVLWSEYQGLPRCIPGILPSKQDAILSINRWIRAVESGLMQTRTNSRQAKATGRGRKRLSDNEASKRLETLKKWETAKAGGVSLKEFCRTEHISVTQFERFRTWAAKQLSRKTS